MLFELLRDIMRACRAQGREAPATHSAGASAYAPEVFRVASLDEAKRIILTPEDATTEERWKKETPYLAGRLAELLGLRAGDLVLDYGCGIGRIAKALIERAGCRVLGIDISESMRALALEYVASPRFSVCSPEDLREWITQGLRADHAVSVWVIQHCEEPAADLDLIASALRPGGRFGVVNNLFRAVPTGGGWFNDGIDVPLLLQRKFTEVSREQLPESVTTARVSRLTFLGLYLRK